MSTSSASPRCSTAWALPAPDWDQPIFQLSGGQKTRALLARLLLERPDLLILDEPTNHLDFQAVEWLEGLLRMWEGALLIVSHDRYFLDNVVNRIWEMGPAGFEVYSGNYSAYVRQRQERWERREIEFTADQRALPGRTRLHQAQHRPGRHQEPGRRPPAPPHPRGARGGGGRAGPAPHQELGPGHGRGGHLRGQVGRAGCRGCHQVPAQPGHSPAPAEPEAQDHACAAATWCCAPASWPSAIRGRRSSPPTRSCWSATSARRSSAPTAAARPPSCARSWASRQPLRGELRFGASLKIGYFSQAHEGLDLNNTVLG